MNKMTIALYAYKSKETEIFNDKGFKIFVGEDDEGNEQINITNDDNDTIKFNCIYNKDEVNDLVSTGTNDPEYLKKTALSGVNEVLKALITYHSLKYANDKLNVIDKNVKTSSNALLELWQWTNSSMFEINNAVNNLINQAAGIDSCHLTKEQRNNIGTFLLKKIYLNI